mmetsp:Transcript_21782/g.30348  ORF Transcript_21782/g.30348 Transcript_21782/m.30348 type:complete len:374 (+) Transcript_21782:175-1296(+)
MTSRVSMKKTIYTCLALFACAIMMGVVTLTSAFTIGGVNRHANMVQHQQSLYHRGGLFSTIKAEADEEATSEDVVLFSDDDNFDLKAFDAAKENSDGAYVAKDAKDSNLPGKQNPRWHSLSPKVKARIRKEAQERAITNKTKREPSDVKKRRLMMSYKKSQREKKRASRVKRSIPFDERTPLSELSEGMDMNGTVISLTNFGAYIDVGTECDGLLHVSQMSETFFVEHPRQVMSPGDEVFVKVRSTNPELKKLHLTKLSEEVLAKEVAQKLDDELENRIPLDDLDVDDELWGEIRRVTDFGAFVELGAVVDGFLHFMDHPSFADNLGEKPNTFMTVGDRVRVWVSDIDMEKNRIKLTANRPQDLPGPRREFIC